MFNPFRFHLDTTTRGCPLLAGDSRDARRSKIFAVQLVCGIVAENINY